VVQCTLLKKGWTFTQLRVLQPYQFILPLAGAKLHRASIVYEFEQYRQKTAHTAQNMACNLDAKIGIGVSWTYLLDVLFIRRKI
jgi:hypothetical protein